LSAVIKVAWFIVVQQALELSKLLDDTLDKDSAYKSDSGRQPYYQPKKYLQFVQEIIDKFIVQGSHSPMQ
jgi:hypothetical protein